MQPSHPIRRALRQRGLEYLWPRARFWWLPGQDASVPYVSPHGWVSGGQQIPLTVSSPARVAYDERSRLIQSTGANLLGWGARQEPGVTNLMLQSENFATTWANTRSDELTNVVAAPDGTTTADEVVATAVSGTHKIRQSVTKAASALQYCFSVFVKAADYSKVRLELSNAVESASCFAAYDLVAETSSTVSATTFTLDAHGLEKLANGWFRIYIVGTTDTDTTVNGWIQLQQTGGATSWTGTGADGIYCWGAQLELGSKPTSYIPTTTGQVARAADATRLTNSGIFGPLSTQGTLLAIFDLPYLVVADTRICALNNGDDSTDNYAAILVNSSAAIRGETVNNSASTTLLSSGVTQVAGTLYAAAVSWGASFQGAAANGVGTTTGAGGGIVGLDRLEIGGRVSADGRAGARHYGIIAFEGKMGEQELEQLTRDPLLWKWAQ